MKIEYDEPIEVTEEQYWKITNKFAGVVAHRSENGKYYIKIWLMSYRDKIAKYLK